MMEQEPDVVVAWDMYRVTRSENWFAWRSSTKVRLVTVKDDVDCTEHDMMTGIRVLVAAEERRKIAERTTAGRRARAEEGKWVGGPPPFGFRVEGEDRDRYLVLDQEETATLRRAANLVSPERTLHEVAETLNAEERLPRQDNPRWHPRSRRIEWDTNKLRYALTRETLIGKHTYGSVVRECPPILNEDEWKRVQSVLTATKRSVYRRQKVYPLSGHLFSPCGMRYSGQFDAHGDRRYYRCKGKEIPPYCTCSRIAAKEVEEQVWFEIVPLLSDPKRLLELTGLDQEDTRAVHREQTKVLAARIDNLTEAITQRAAQALKSGIDPDLIAAAVQELERERAVAEERRAKFEEWEAMRREREERRKRLVRLSEHPNPKTRASWRLLKPTLDFQKTLFSLLDVTVEVKDDGLQIRGTFREDLPELLHVVDSTAVRSSSATATSMRRG
jgi:Resolvase, N terminal domain/Recombinase/Recombinase zinc beta ribbon domain